MTEQELQVLGDKAAWHWEQGRLKAAQGRAYLTRMVMSLKRIGHLKRVTVPFGAGWMKKE